MNRPLELKHHLRVTEPWSEKKIFCIDIGDIWALRLQTGLVYLNLWSVLLPFHMTLLIKTGGLKRWKKKKTDVVALHKARVAQKKEFSRKRCRPRVAAAACEGFWYRVIEALLPGSEGGRRLTAQILFGYVSVCVWKTDEMVLFERRSLD